MSKKESSPESADLAPDLSALDFGPAWAREDQKKKPRTSGKDQEGGRKRDRQGSRQSDQDRRGREPRGERRGSYRRDVGKSGRHDQKKYNKKRPHRTVVPAPEGVSARIMPIEEGMDAMAKEIQATARTHSVFDLAWLVLGALDRFHVVFESEDEPLYRSRGDHSVWLHKRECLEHFWSAGLIGKYYDEEITEVEPPSGNFQSVARCGFSGKLIGPPNHHAYQQTLMDLHREKFSNVSLDHYKGKIVMEHSEEAVEEWLEAMKKHTRWRPKQVKIEQAEPAEGKAPSAGEETDEPIESSVVEATDKATEVASPIEETVVILDSRREVEKHFLAHGFEEEFEVSKTVSALANIPPRMISPALMTLLKNIVIEEKRYPGKLASILCRQMTGRHLAVFKWKKRLHCGPARPKHIADDMVMADRPAKLFHWVTTHSGGNIDNMWSESLPEGIDDDTRHLWYHDLHWLINEGLVLLFSDGTLHAAKELDKPTVSKQQKPAEEKEVTEAEKPEKEKTSGNEPLEMSKEESE